LSYGKKEAEYGMERPYKNNDVKDITNFSVLDELVLCRKWKQAGHLARVKDNRALDLTKWTAQNESKPGRPKMRWSDNITKHAGTK